MPEVVKFKTVLKTRGCKTLKTERPRRKNGNLATFTAKIANLILTN